MFKQVPTREIKRRIESGDTPVLLDVRRQDEWEEKQLPGAIHIPLEEIETRLNELENYKNSELIVYCRTGNRSSQACMLLEMFDFNNLVNMQGGIAVW